MTVIKVIIADDHRMVTDGLQSIIDNSDDFRVIQTVENGRELIRILEILETDLVLMDLDMPVMNGLEAMQEIRKKYPAMRVIVLTMHEEKSLVKKLTDLGAKGYLFKNADKDELLTAMRRVYEGGVYFSAGLTLGLINTQLGQTSSYDEKKGLLTDREIEILKLIASGKSNKEIGDELFISHRTVDTHRTNLMKKLEVNNIAGLIRYAIKHGYLH